jgi:DMSO/TMAO reductase YedYZ molybdopterin-dependent catalytic subunit
MGLVRARRERKARALGHNSARPPPGQSVTEKWPVLHTGAVPRSDLDTWTLRVFGEIGGPIELTYAELRALPRTEVVLDIHCVTGWSRLGTRFAGVSWRDLAELAPPLPAARYVVAHAEHGYTANVPLATLARSDALLAWEADGEPLTPDHGWPLRLVVPGRYFWKSAKWLRALELTGDDRPGFWERRGYHNDADPFLQQRYAF